MLNPESPRPGHVDLVGAGPGDPGLITRKGSDCLKRAEVVVYDHLVHPRLLDLAPPTAERIFAGKSAGKCALKQPEINALIASLAKRGKRVVRLKGGDPYVFGRGGEEAEHLRAEGVSFTVVPGVTAAVGVSSYAGIPITHRDSASAVAFVTGHNDPGSAASRIDWSALARFPGTLVVYMGVSKLKMLCEILTVEGKPATTPAALVQNGTLASQTTVTGTLGDLADRAAVAGLGPPGLLIIGDVVNHRPALSWFERSPLFGKRIVVTRPEGDSDSSASDLEALGAEVLVAPMVRILPNEDFEAMDRVIDRLGEFDWLVFTSGNGVRHFLARIDALGKDLRVLGDIKLAAIGPATARTLSEYRLKADLVPDSYRSEALADALRPHVSGRRVLLARADRGRTILKDELERVAHVEQVAVYRNADAEALPPEILDRLSRGEVDWITLTSPAIVNRLHALLPEAARALIGREIQLASISPVTTQAANDLGWPVAAEAKEYTWDGVVRALVRG